MRTDQFSDNVAGSTSPRYFFHLKRGQVIVLDQEGVELADLEEAEREAVRRGREIAARDALQGAPGGAVIVVANDHWLPIFEVPMEEDGDSDI